MQPTIVPGGRRRPGPALPLLAAALLAAGCGGPAARVPEPGEALPALRAALESWQQGESPDSLLGRRPAISVADPDWAQGARLVRFEIEEGGARPSGFDLGVPVRLWLGEGGKEPRQVRYTIATSPRLVVARDFGG